MLPHNPGYSRSGPFLLGADLSASFVDEFVDLGRLPDKNINNSTYLDSVTGGGRATGIQPSPNGNVLSSTWERDWDPNRSLKRQRNSRRRKLEYHSHIESDFRTSKPQPEGT